MFPDLRAYEAPPTPVRAELENNETVYISTSLRFDGGTWARGNERRVGGLLDLVEHLGSDRQDQAALVSFEAELRQRVGPEVLRAGARSFADALSDRMLELEGEERDAVHDLAAALREYATERATSLMDL